MTTTRSHRASPATASSTRIDPDPYKWPAIWAALVFTFTLPVILSAIVFLKPDPGSAGFGARSTLVGGGAAPGGGTASPLGGLGRSTYTSSCAVCHGPDGDGVPSLGKPLHNSAFVQAQTDEQLFTLVVDGRMPGDPANTTGALMPPRGAQNLSDEAVHAVIDYLRSIQDPGAEPVSVEAWNLVGPDGTGGGSAAIELTDHPGYDLFVASCAACHGQGGEGIDGLGLPMTTSGFIRGLEDADLIKFIKSGRASWDANNTTGLDMPPKGGNPAITDEQLQTIVDYIRALQKKAMGS